ncbi:MAG TPA: nitrous oxide-stimulated promoter family protein [Parabacteroides sp.]|nr:nitrous oxide-stimulated promoter family protein [Parabacteroides sp.]
MKKKSSKIEKEKQVVKWMVELYCRKKEGNEELCPECLLLLDYAYKRLECCKFGEKKSSCQRCPIHCYKKDMRKRMKQIMRFSGPRMLLYYPIAALKHMLQ